ncbi:hypothetical protein [Streptomyces sp. NPDC001978]|uniref:hypothetical protein n=1 Tax=Streptomyces sp. NPDC001978 TaxID=3364627 RepID=UPI0036CA3C83
MDSGLAAVLGATVGAVGTGGAAVVAALFARSQVRMQLRAEHQRSLRDPRKAAYVTLAECWRSKHERASDAWMELRMTANHRGESEFAELLRAPSDHRAAAFNLTAALEHAQAVVYVEGPKAVTDASIHVSAELTSFLGKVHDANKAVHEGVSLDMHTEACEEARGNAYRQYLCFLYAASEVLGGDVL